MVYKHKKSQIIVEPAVGQPKYYCWYGADAYNFIPKEVIEDSDDWELIDDGERYSIADIKKALVAINTKWQILPLFIEQLIKSLKDTKNG